MCTTLHPPVNIEEATALTGCEIGSSIDLPLHSGTLKFRQSILAKEQALVRLPHPEYF
jgi:hypothetical protein